MIDNDKIIEIAALQLKLDRQSGSDGDLRNFDRELDQLDTLGFQMVLFAATLMEGKPHSIRADNSEIITLHRTLAQHLGASVELIEQGTGFTRITFSPPPRQ